MKHTRTSRVLLTTAIAGLSLASNAANILWVSDNTAEGSGFGALPASSEVGFFNLMTSAGHTLTHYNPPNAGTMSAADIAQINTFDLVIVGRSIASGAFQSSAQATVWNTLITVPVLTDNAYLIRGGTGGGNRMGWFNGETVPDGSPTTVTQTSTDEIGNYIFNGVSLSGSTTTNPYDEAINRNTSQITSPIVAGGVTYATANFIPLGGTVAVTSTVIAFWDTGTLVRGSNVLAGDRWYIAAGAREGTVGGVPAAGVENLTPTGERLFLNTVDAALGVPEPSTFALFGLGAVAAFFAARRRK